MPVVGMPDGTQVSFPDEMPPNQIQGLIAQKFPEAVKQVAPQGFVGHAKDFLRSIPGGAVSGLGGILSATGQAAQAEMSQPPDNPTPEEATAALEKGVTGPLPTPQGPAGQYGRTLGSFAAQAPFGPPGQGAVARGLQIAVPALLSETGGQISKGTALEPAMRLGGAAVGAVAAGRAPKAATTEEAITAARGFTPAPAKAELATAAKEGYRAVDKSTATFSPEIMGVLAEDINAALKKSGVRDYREGHGAVLGAVKELGGESTISGIDNVRKALGDIGAEAKNPSTRKAVATSIEKIDDFLRRNEPETAAALKEAQSNTAALKRAEKIDQAQDIAGVNATKAGYGGNSVNAMRQTIAPFVKKAIKGNNQGFSQDEISAMRDISDGTNTTNALRTLSQFSPDKGILNTLGGAVAHATGVGAVSNKLATVLTSRQIDRLNELVRKRSPAYEEAVTKAASRYFDAADELASNPSSAAFAKLIGASRGFSAGLRKDGIEVSSGDLLRQMQGPMRSPADEEQPKPEGVVNQ